MLYTYLHTYILVRWIDKYAMHESTVVQTSGSKLAMVKKMKLCPMAEQIEKYRIFCMMRGLPRQN
jgi:hypothetical protein